MIIRDRMLIEAMLWLGEGSLKEVAEHLDMPRQQVKQMIDLSSVYAEESGVVDGHYSVIFSLADHLTPRGEIKRELRGDLPKKLLHNGVQMYVIEEPSMEQILEMAEGKMRK